MRTFVCLLVVATLFGVGLAAGQTLPARAVPRPPVYVNGSPTYQSELDAVAELANPRNRMYALGYLQRVKIHDPDAEAALVVELSAVDPKTRQAAKDASRVVETGRAVVFKGLLDTKLVDAIDVDNFGYFRGAPSAETQACLEAFAAAVRGGKAFDKGIYYGVNLFARKLDESSLAAAYAGALGAPGEAEEIAATSLTQFLFWNRPGTQRVLTEKYRAGDAGVQRFVEETIAEKSRDQQYGPMVERMEKAFGGIATPEQHVRLILLARAGDGGASQGRALRDLLADPSPAVHTAVVGAIRDFLRDFSEGPKGALRRAALTGEWGPEPQGIVVAFLEDATPEVRGAMWHELDDPGLIVWGSGMRGAPGLDRILETAAYGPDEKIRQIAAQLYGALHGGARPPLNPPPFFALLVALLALPSVVLGGLIGWSFFRRVGPVWGGEESGKSFSRAAVVAGFCGVVLVLYQMVVLAMLLRHISKLPAAWVAVIPILILAAFMVDGAAIILWGMKAESQRWLEGTVFLVLAGGTSIVLLVETFFSVLALTNGSWLEIVMNVVNGLTALGLLYACGLVIQGWVVRRRTAGLEVPAGQTFSGP